MKVDIHKRDFYHEIIPCRKLSSCKYVL